jgi:nucleotide-binding universal stress UspA family protein
MTQVVVPVRYPLSEHSRATLQRAIEIAEAEDAELTVLHVNLYQNSARVTRSELKEAVESAFGQLDKVRYVVRTGLLVEETILDEVASQKADIVVIGQKQASSWRRMIRRVVDDPDIEDFLQHELDARIVTASLGD